MTKHIIYSHGFGVRKDDRGLFTDIAVALPDAQHTMFNYNQIHEATNSLTVAPLDEQAEKLRQVITQVKAGNPEVVIDLICHSQGCVVAALAQPAGIRNIIFTAPPVALLDTEQKINEICAKYGITFTKQDTVRIPRKDGSTTIIPPEYWRVRDNLDAQTMYNQLAENSQLTIIVATQDEVLGSVVFDRLSPRVNVIEMSTGHNFEGEARQELIGVIAGIVGKGRS